MVIWYILWLFGMLCFPPFWYFAPRKFWQPWGKNWVKFDPPTKRRERLAQSRGFESRQMYILCGEACCRFFRARKLIASQLCEDGRKNKIKDWLLDCQNPSICRLQRKEKLFGNVARMGNKAFA
jgi:hypothetical protein